MSSSQPSAKTSQPMAPNDLRAAYLNFFAAQGHAIVPSSPLVPDNDPTTLFTGSGMQPMMPYLLGATHPEGSRLVDSQKCFRSQDIEEVGDNRHTTFFEMLGNWSLGDYFKKEQLRWFFTFLTEEVGLDAKKIYVTTFRGDETIGIPRDEEAEQIWQELFAEKGITATVVNESEKNGMQDGRIFPYEAKKNWWSRVGVPGNMPVGEPGGPDSEVFFDFGADRKLHGNSPFADQPCHVNCDCGRFLEIGNSVFMTYVRTAKGFEPLKQKNIDFGGGFERILAAQNNDPDVFLTELFQPFITQLEQLTGLSYSQDPQAQRTFRIILDHLRAASMLIVDGVMPSNKGQGYVLRRLLRRAALKLHLLKTVDIVALVDIAKSVIQSYDGIHNVVAAKHESIVAETISSELKKFQRTLDGGLKVLEKTQNVDGKVAFDLYQTYGFPLELTTELLDQRGEKIDLEQFAAEFNKHKELSRTASAGTFKGGLAEHSEVTTKYHTATHLLQAALRKVLGKHVQQKGSNITVERMRFDFSHPAALTEEEKQKVEAQVNEWIKQDLPMTMKMMPKQVALDSGAIAFFVEKYPAEVSVYTIGKDADSDWISKELCGGPHVKSTGEIGSIKISKEQASSAGVRRIYMELEK